MKRVRCPKCGNYIIFDEARYANNQSLVFECPECGKQFGIRIGVTKLGNRPVGNDGDEELEANSVGYIVVIQNVFHLKQVLQLSMGDNVIGKYFKNNNINCPIETSDPSVDLHHCVINVSKSKCGELSYVLRDGPSYTGTFVDNEILGDHEHRVIDDGSLFTIGATSVILHTK